MNEAMGVKMPEIRQEIDLLREALSDMAVAIDNTEKRLDGVMRPETPTPPEEAVRERPAPITPFGNTVREMRNGAVVQCKRLHRILNRVEV